MAIIHTAHFGHCNCPFWALSAIEIVGINFKEVEVQGLRDAHKLMGVDGLLMKDFCHSAYVARQLPRQPVVGKPLLAQLRFNQFSYVGLLFHFVFVSRPYHKSTKRKKRKPFRFLCLLSYQGTPTFMPSKHETVHAIRREPSQLISAYCLFGVFW